MVFGNNRSTFEMYEYLILTFKFKPMKKFSPAMSVIVGLFMLFAGIYSVYGGGKTAVIVKQVKVGGGPVCLSENIPLVFYDSSEYSRGHCIGRREQDGAVDNFRQLWHGCM